MAGIKPRVIALTKREGQTFGFFLRVERDEEGHLIRSLDMGGAAELAGLKDGDRIIRVNGVFVDNMEHAQVAELVRKSGMSVNFHVLGEAAYKEAKEKGWDMGEIPRQNVMNGAATGPAVKPKLCYLLKSTSGYQFSLKSVKGEKGLFMMDVTKGGSADTAGVKDNDRILEVNGENVEDATHEKVVEKVKASGNTVMFLLIDQETDRHFKNKRIALVSSLATVKHLPYKPRIADLTKGSDGYGFYLRKEPKMSGHFIKDIDRGGPAEKAGLKDMDRLVAVAGVSVDNCNHDQVVDKIRQGGNKCCLLVVDSETDKMYKLGKVSPLLFWEETQASKPEPAKTPEPKPATPPPSYKPEPTPAVVPVPVPTPCPVPPPADDYKPKLCRMVKAPSGFGFHLNGIQGVPGQYIKEVVKDGAADKAGLEDDDMVVEVNGKNVEGATHEEVVNMIRNTGDTLVLLVAGRTTYDHLKASGVAITTALLGVEVARPPSPKLPEPARPPSPKLPEPARPPSPKLPEPARSPSPKLPEPPAPPSPKLPESPRPASPKLPEPVAPPSPKLPESPRSASPKLPAPPSPKLPDSPRSASPVAPPSPKLPDSPRSASPVAPPSPKLPEPPRAPSPKLPEEPRPPSPKLPEPRSASPQEEKKEDKKEEKVAEKEAARPDTPPQPRARTPSASSSSGESLDEQL